MFVRPGSHEVWPPWRTMHHDVVRAVQTIDAESDRDDGSDQLMEQEGTEEVHSVKRLD